MSVGTTIVRLRLGAGKSQRAVARDAHLAPSYLSRLENDRLTPTVRTLSKLARALDVPLTAFFASPADLDPPDRCPVSLCGQCLLDQLSAGRGRRRRSARESYTSEQMEALRLCNFLLHVEDRSVPRALLTMLKSLAALSEARAAARC